MNVNKLHPVTKEYSYDLTQTYYKTLFANLGKYLSKELRIK